MNMKACPIFVKLRGCATDQHCQSLKFSRMLESYCGDNIYQYISYCNMTPMTWPDKLFKHHLQPTNQYKGHWHLYMYTKSSPVLGRHLASFSHFFIDRTWMISISLVVFCWPWMLMSQQLRWYWSRFSCLRVLSCSGMVDIN